MSSFEEIKEELRRAKFEVKSLANVYLDISADEFAEHYGQGLEDALNYFENLEEMLSSAAQEERYEKLQNRIIVIPDNQIKLFD